MNEFVYEKLQSINRDWERSHAEVLDALPPDVAASWKRSFSFGVDADATALPPITKQERTMAEASFAELSATAGPMLADFFCTLEDFLTREGTAAFVANQSMRIVHACGATGVLDELARRNITYGALLSERNAGTSALSLAAMSNDTQITGSQECYSRLFAGYAAIARRVSPALNVYALIVIPETPEWQSHLPAIEFALGALSAMLARRESPHVPIKAQVLGLTLRSELSAYVIVDLQGKIISIDSRLVASLGDLPPQNIKGMNLTGLFPSMAPLMSSALKCTKESRRLSVLGVVRFRERNYRIRCAPVVGEDGTRLIVFTSTLLFETGPVSACVSHSDYLQGESPVIKRLHERINRAARTDTHVLISGEAGTDKERIAGMVHRESKRRTGPFIRVHCSSASGPQLRMRLFGRERSSVEDGIYAYGGALWDAQGGTLFLDEVEAMPLDVQAALAHFLEEQNRRIVRGIDSPDDNVRVIAASTSDLAVLVREGRMRTDLYYLLSAFSIKTVPLRDRPDDIPAIIASAARGVADRFQTEPVKFSDGALARLSAHLWPGNMRELGRLILRAHYEDAASPVTAKELPLLMGSELLEASGLAANVPSNHNAVGDAASTPQNELSPQHDARLEHDELLEILAETHGNKTIAARKLGITRQTLYNRMRKAGL